MTPGLPIGPAPLRPRITGPQPVRPVTGTVVANDPATGKPFAEALAEVMATPQTPSPVRLSGHAQQRLTQASRALSDPELARVAGAVEMAARKGSRDALILLPDMALVVNVPSRTVITAVTQDRLRENVFTNIDAAVLI